MRKAKDMLFADRWDSLIAFWSESLGMDQLLIKAVVRQESGGNARAVSPAGARGLMQLMPATAHELHVPFEHIYDPDCNLRAGISYLRDQIRHFPEIPDETERIKFALAAYNAGRGNINKALRLACRVDGQIRYELDVLQESWQEWDVTKLYLPNITGKHANETIVYVSRVMGYWSELKEKESILRPDLSRTTEDGEAEHV